MGTRPKRRWLRRIAIGVGCLAVVLVIAGLLLGHYLRTAVDAEQLEVLVNKTLAKATDGLYEASIGGIEWGAVGFSLGLSDLSVMLVMETLEEMDAAGTTPSILFQVQHATVKVAGVDLWSLLTKRGFRALSVTLEQPLIQFSGLEDIIGPTKKRKRPSTDAAGGKGAAAVAGPPERAPGSPPRVQIGRVSIDGASFENYRRQKADEVEDRFDLFERFDNIDIELTGIDLADDREARLLFADDVSVEITDYRFRWPDGLHEERHGLISLSTAGGYIRAENLSYVPVFERRAEVAEDGTSPSAVKAEIDRIGVEGIDFAAIVDSLSFSAEEFSIDGARIEVTADPQASGPRPAAAGAATAAVTEVRPGALLTAALVGLPEIHVDRLRIENLDVHIWDDREGDVWLDELRSRLSVENLELELLGYASGPDVEFEVTRPFFSDQASASMARAATILGDGGHRLSLDGWRMSDAQQSLSVSSLAIDPLRDRRQLSATGIEPPDSLELATGEISLTGLDYGSLLDDVDLEVEELRIESSRVRLTTSEGDDRDRARAREEAAQRGLVEVLDRVLPGMPNVRVASLTTADGSFELLVDRTVEGWLPAPARRLVATEIELSLDDLVHREGDGYDVQRPLLASGGSLGVGLLDLALGDGFEHLLVRGMRVTPDPEGATIDSIEVAPFDSDPALLGERIRDKGVVPRITAGPIELIGDPLTSFLEEGRLDVERLEIHQPRIELLKTSAPFGVKGPQPAETRTSSATLGDLVDGLPPIRVGHFSILGAAFDRYVGAIDQDWSNLPEQLESIRRLDLTLEGFDTASRGGTGRLLLSDRLELMVDDVLLALGESGDTLRLGSLALSSDADSLSVADALLSIGGSDGDNQFKVGRVEVGNVPYGRIFRALIEPPESGAPALAAMVDKDMTLDIDGVDGELDGGKRLFRIGPISGSAARGSLQIDGFSLVPTMADADPTTPQTEVFSQELVLRAGEVEISGVDFVRLAKEGALDASTFTLDQPSVEVIQGIGVSSDPPAPTRAASPAATRLVDQIEAVVAELPVVAIERLRIDDIALRERPSLEGDPVRGLTGIDLAIDGLDLRPDRDAAAAEGALYATDIRLHVPQQQTWVGKARYELEVGPADLSTGRGSLGLGGVRYQLPASAEQYLGRPLVMESARIDLVVDEVSLEGIDLTSLLRDEHIRVGRVQLSGWNLWILSDQKKPKRPKVGPRFSPHRLVQGLPVLFSIDDIQLVDGALRYSVRSPLGEQPGHLWWDRLQGHILNASNDPTRMSVDTPMDLIVSGRMLDEAALELEWRIPLLEPAPTMSYSATISSLPATALSSILLPTEGVRLRGGTLQSVWLDIDVRDGHGTGSFNSLFRGLGVQFEDRNTGKRGFGKRVLTFAANVVLPSNNYGRDGRPARVGKVDYQVPEQVSFFKAFWDAIKSGVIDLMI